MSQETVAMNNNNHITCFNCPVIQDSVFRQCPSRVLTQLEGIKDHVFLEADEILFVEGAPATSLYCQASGRVALTRNDADGGAHILCVTGPGTLLGFRDAFREERYPFSAVVVERGEFCAIPAEALKVISAEEPSILLQMIATLCRQIEDVNDRLASTRN
jgi:CRP-like cAMP-binding protein